MAPYRPAGQLQLRSIAQFPLIVQWRVTTAVRQIARQNPITEGSLLPPVLQEATIPRLAGRAKSIPARAMTSTLFLGLNWVCPITSYIVATAPQVWPRAALTQAIL